MGVDSFLLIAFSEKNIHSDPYLALKK